MIKQIPKLVFLLIVTFVCLSIFQERKAFVQEKRGETFTPKSVQIENSDDRKILMADYFTKANEINYKEFQIKKVKNHSKISDLIIKKNGIPQLTIKGIYYPLGNELDFGLFSLLGNNEKQLIISDTIPRGGRHYVISLESNPKIVFDSQKFGVGREDFSVEDIDKDGLYEFTLETTDFYGFENFVNSEAPLIPIYFKFNKEKGQFLPANHLLSKSLEQSLNKEVKEFDSLENKTLSQNLNITLQYIFMGNEVAGWNFFEKNYTATQKDKIKKKIISILNKNKVYKFIQKDLRKNA